MCMMNIIYICKDKRSWRHHRHTSTKRIYHKNRFAFTHSSRTWIPVCLAVWFPEEKNHGNMYYIDTTIIIKHFQLATRAETKALCERKSTKKTILVYCLCKIYYYRYHMKEMLRGDCKKVREIAASKNGWATKSKTKIWNERTNEQSIISWMKRQPQRHWRNIFKYT